MRIVVTGKAGQVAQALIERAPAGITVIALGRPLLDLERFDTIAPAIVTARPDLVVNAAAFTTVDLAESHEETASLVNGRAAGMVAWAARATGAPMIQISTDYVFGGSLDRPYRENDRVEPISAYGRSKLEGERAVAAATRDHTILRTAWIYSPFGKNFVKTMIQLAAERSEVSIVADQMGCPTSALDIADAIFTVARNLTARPNDATLRGTFHMAAQGEAVWADVAEAIFAELVGSGHPSVAVRRIAMADYPTPARRPANSRLDSALLAATHGVRLPHWRVALPACVSRLIAARQTGQTL